MNTAHTHNHPELSLAERIEQARAIVEGAKERFTPLRAHVLELIIADGKAVKAYDLLDRLKPDVGSPKPPTVYRALEFLSRHGLIHRVEALNAFIACDHNHLHDQKNASPWMNATPMTMQNVNRKVSPSRAPSLNIMALARPAKTRLRRLKLCKTTSSLTLHSPGLVNVRLGNAMS